MNSLGKKLAIILMLIGLTFTTVPFAMDYASAKEDEPTSNEIKAANALKNAGIDTADNSAKDKGMMKSLSKLVYVIMGIGALWAVAWIVIGGMILSGSGSNAQKRTAGMAAIGVAAAGLFVIYKAFDIANWAVNL